MRKKNKIRKKKLPDNAIAAHICKFNIIRGSGKRTGTPAWRCICDKISIAS